MVSICLLSITLQRWKERLKTLLEQLLLKKTNMSSHLGRDYFLKELHQNEDIKKEVKKDVTVSEDALKQLEALGLIKETKTDV